MYREYILIVRPSRDFLQELLWHGRNIIVLKPENLRQEMIGILKDMTKSYETGECLNGEEERNLCLLFIFHQSGTCEDADA